MRFEAVTKREEAVVLAEVSSAINGAGGWVSDHKLYSNIMAMLAFEIPATRLDDLLKQLEVLGLDVHSKSDVPPNTGDVSAQLTITFLHDKPDQRREIPSVG